MGRPIRPRPMNPTCFTVESPSLRGSVILSYIGETMTRLKNKAAFITGAGGGIGRAIADAMEREGARVARVDIDGKTPYQCDVSDRRAVFRAMERFVTEAGGLDILVNNAVYFYYAPLVDMPEDKIHRMLDVGAKGAYWATHAAPPHLITRRRRTVSHISSVAASFR